MAEGTRESHFEDDVVKYLIGTNQYSQKETISYDKDLCLIPEDVIAFIEETRPEQYKKLQNEYHDHTDRKIIENVAKSISSNKTTHFSNKTIHALQYNSRRAFPSTSRLRSKPQCDNQ